MTTIVIENSVESTKNNYRDTERDEIKLILKAIRRECRYCMGDSFDSCTSPNCALYNYRSGQWTNDYTLNKLLEAIESKCLECVGYDHEEIENCTGNNVCKIWHIRDEYLTLKHMNHEK